MDETINLHIRTTSGAPDTTVVISSKDTVGNLAEKIKKDLEITDASSNKKIRMISAGKLLQPPESLLSSHHLTDGSYIHVVVSEEAAETSSASSSESSGVSINTGRGFDRLFGSGVRPSIVSALRASFRRSVAPHVSSVPRQANESEEDLLLRLEECWLTRNDPNILSQPRFITRNPGMPLALSPFSMSIGRSMGRWIGFAAVPNNLRNNAPTQPNIPQPTLPQSMFPSPSSSEVTSLLERSNGGLRDFVLGFLCGFFLGFLMVFCMWDRNVSSRMKTGILCGILAQLLLELVGSRPNQMSLRKNGQLQQTTQTVDASSMSLSSASSSDASNGVQWSAPAGSDAVVLTTVTN